MTTATQLGVHEKVTASAQNAAKQAMFFPYRQALRIELSGVNVLRARKDRP